MVRDWYDGLTIPDPDLTRSFQIWADHETFGTWPRGWPDDFPNRIVLELYTISQVASDVRWAQERESARRAEEENQRGW